MACAGGADDVFQFLGEALVLTDFEAFYQVRLQTMGMPDTAYRGLTDAHFCGHRARAPVGGVGLAAISISVLPSAAKSTTLARSICRAGSERDLAHCCRVFRCELSRVTGGATRIGRLLDYRDVRIALLATIYDALH
jgi:hypothetical protein